MNEVVIVAACRTAIGRHGSAFKNLSALELTLPVMKELLSRSRMDGSLIDDVIWGCNYQKTYLENNIARVAAVRPGYPTQCPASRFTGTARPPCPPSRWGITRSNAERPMSSWLAARTA